MDITLLIERCRQGDADALEELYKAYAQRMKSICRRYISDEQAVEDVLHDAFVIILTSLERLRNDRNAEAWMMSITRNVASKYKDRLNSPSLVSLEAMESIVSSNEESTIKGIPLENVLKLTEKLPDGYGKVFRLSVFEGMTHKEIADMLGIKPHSSSSQLARAKKMIRKMMQQYWLGGLLLLFIPFTCFLFKKGDTPIKDIKTVVAKQEATIKESDKVSRIELSQESVIVQRPVPHSIFLVTDTLLSIIAKDVDSATSDTLSNSIAQEQMLTDSIAMDTTQTIHKAEIPHYYIANLAPKKHIIDTGHQNRWAIKLAYTGGQSVLKAVHPYGFTETPTLGITGGTISPVTFKNWSDYAAFLAQEPDDSRNHIRNVIMNIALNNASDIASADTDKIIRKSHHYMPINISLTLRYRLNNSFALETGLNYSQLKSEFEMGSNGNTISEQQTLHYLGVPVKGIYKIYNRKSWNLYGSLGVTTEIPVYSQLDTSYFLHGIFEANNKSRIRVPWQWSMGSGIGLQYNLTPNIGLFAEPNLQYYIPTGSNVETHRTEHPFTFSLPLGIRFTW